MEGFWIVLVIAALWMFFAPLFILGRLRTLEEKIEKSEQRLARQLMEARSGAADEADQADRTDPIASLREADLREAEAAYERHFGEALTKEHAPSPEMSAPAGALFAEAEAPAEATEVEPSAPDEPIPAFLPEAGEGAEADERPPLAPAPPAIPREPGPFGLAAARFLSWLLKEGNIWVCAGVLLLLVGFGLLFSYVIQRGFLTFEMRLAAGAAAGIAMTGFGFRIRERRRAYGLILQGGGMGVLYLVVLASAKFTLPSAGQPLLPPALAVAAMLVLSVFTVLLALLQDYQPLAIAAILGGFAAPILVSTGSRNHIALFSIYSLLNFEILALTLRRDWRLLSRMGFVLTAVIGAAWGARDWRPELFGSVEPFLLIFLATYTAIAMISVRKRDRAPDLFLAVTTPFCFFFMQTQTVGHLRYGMALTCLGLGLWHLLCGAWLRRGILERADEADIADKKSAPGAELALPRLYMFLCILFSNLVAAYTFEGQTAAAIWAVEAAFLIAAAARSGSCKALAGGAVLHAGALALYLHRVGRVVHTISLPSGIVSQLGAAEPHLSIFFASGTLFALALLYSGFCASRFRPAAGPLSDRWEEALQKHMGDGSWARGALSWALTVLGSLCWWATLYDQLLRLEVAVWDTFFPAVCLTALAGCWLSVRLNWRAARFLLLCPVALAFAALAQPLHIGAFPFRSLQLQALAYALCVIGSLRALRGAGRTAFSPFTLFAALLSGLLLTEAAIREFNFLGNLALPLSALPLLGLLLYRRRLGPEASSLRRPRGDGWNDTAAVACASGIILLFGTLGFFGSFAEAGDAFGVYLPFLNPLELWQAASLLSLFLWAGAFFLNGAALSKWPKLPLWAFAALLFVWFNQAAVRMSWHYWGDGALYYSFGGTLRTPACQAAIAIFWGALGLAWILYGQRTRSRGLWLAGAGLIAADILKLLLLDLRGAATVVRILAFLALGGLTFLIGWIAPLPPKAANPKEESHDDEP